MPRPARRRPRGVTIRTILAAGLAFLAAPAMGATEPEGLVVGIGDSWAFRVGDRGEPLAPRRVTDGLPPQDGEVAVTLIDRGGQVVLALMNNSGGYLNYRAFLRLSGTTAERATDVCTLMTNGRPTFEAWHDRIVAIRLTGFEHAADGSMVCR